AGPVFERAIGWAGEGLDVAIVRVALAASRGKKRREREVRDRLGHYERMAAEYAALDHAHFYAEPPPIRAVEERPVRPLDGGEGIDLTGPSGYEPRLSAAREAFLTHRANGIVHARHFRHRHAAPVAVCISGYRSPSFAIEERTWRAKLLYERGLD